MRKSRSYSRRLEGVSLILVGVRAAEAGSTQDDCFLRPGPLLYPSRRFTPTKEHL